MGERKLKIPWQTLSIASGSSVVMLEVLSSSESINKLQSKQQKSRIRTAFKCFQWRRYERNKSIDEISALSVCICGQPRIILGSAQTHKKPSQVLLNFIYFRYKLKRPVCLNLSGIIHCSCWFNNLGLIHLSAWFPIKFYHSGHVWLMWWHKPRRA